MVCVDFDYILDFEFIIGVKGGVRLFKLEYDSVFGGSGINNWIEVIFSDEVVVMVNDVCWNNVFFELGFFDDEIGGVLFFINVDSEGNVISVGIGNFFVMFDLICLVEILFGIVINDVGEVLIIVNVFLMVDDLDR